MKSANEQDVINPEPSPAKRRVDAYRERWLKANTYYCEGFSSEQIEKIKYLVGQAYMDGFIDGLWWKPEEDAA